MFKHGKGLTYSQIQLNIHTHPRTYFSYPCSFRVFSLLFTTIPVLALALTAVYYIPAGHLDCRGSSWNSKLAISGRTELQAHLTTSKSAGNSPSKGLLRGVVK